MIEKKYNAEESEELRQRLIEDHISPGFKAVVAAFPVVKSACLMVAQFWSDEAEDAVSFEILFSEFGCPDLKGFRAAELAVCLGQSKQEAGNAPNLPSLTPQECHEISDLMLEHSRAWPENWDAISAFAAFCTEGATQWDMVSSAYSPYAVLSLDRDGAVQVEVIGEMVRPWLDGVRGERDFS